jgi:hypothetical protein
MMDNTSHLLADNDEELLQFGCLVGTLIRHHPAAGQGDQF